MCVCVRARARVCVCACVRVFVFGGDGEWLLEWGDGGGGLTTGQTKITAYTSVRIKACLFPGYADLNHELKYQKLAVNTNLAAIPCSDFHPPSSLTGVLCRRGP